MPVMARQARSQCWPASVLQPLRRSSARDADGTSEKLHDHVIGRPQPYRDQCRGLNNDTSLDLYSMACARALHPPICLRFANFKAEFRENGANWQISQAVAHVVVIRAASYH